MHAIRCFWCVVLTVLAGPVAQAQTTGEAPAGDPPAAVPAPVERQAKPAPKKAVAPPAVVLAPPVWTSLNGHTVTAHFVELKDGTVVLKDEGGATRNVRLGLLIPADQARAQELEAKRIAGPAAEASGASSRVLPVFREGAAKGLHAVYSNANFVATVLASGDLTVTCLDDGKPAGKPIVFGPSYGYADKSKNSRYTARRIVSFDKAPKPTLAPAVLSYETTLDDDVKAGYSYEFKKNTVQVWGWVEDPAGLSYPTGMHLRFAFHASHDFPDHLPVVERKKVVAPFALVIEPTEGKPVRYPYGDKVKRLASPAKHAEIAGPLFGKRRVSLDALNVKDAPLAPWLYTDYAPYQGYSIGLQKTERSSRNERERMILTVD